jgi:hypothetical protein
MDRARLGCNATDRHGHCHREGGWNHPADAGFGVSTAQFLMTLDTSVMNVAIATVAKDVGTTVTGI